MGVRRTRSATCATALLAIVAGCSDGDDVPSADEWQPRWDEVRDIVPAAEVIAGERGEEVCGDVLGTLREARDDAFPTPQAVLDDSVNSWFADAEALLFDCPSDLDVATERREALDVQGAEIDAGLDEAGSQE